MITKPDPEGVRFRSVITANEDMVVSQLRSDGWYHNGTWAKAKTFVRDKIDELVKGNVPNDEDYVNLAANIPEVLKTGEKIQYSSSGRPSKKEIELGGLIRSIARDPATAAKRRREEQKQKLRQNGNESGKRTGASDAAAEDEQNDDEDDHDAADREDVESDQMPEESDDVEDTDEE